MAVAVTPSILAASPQSKPRWIELERTGYEIAYLDVNWRKNVEIAAKIYPAARTKVEIIRERRDVPYARVVHEYAVDCRNRRVAIVGTVATEKSTGKTARMPSEQFEFLDPFSLRAHNPVASAIFRKACGR